MIKLAEGLDGVQTSEPINPYSLRINALARAYAGTGVCSFYRDDKTGAVMAKYGNALIYGGQVLSDFEELGAFCRAVGVKSLLCDGDFQCGCFNKACGTVLKLGEMINHRTHLSAVNIEFNSGLREIYGLLRRNMFNDRSKLVFEDFYVDMSHRIRHGCAQSCILKIGGAPCSCALAAFTYNDGAAISSVCTEKAFRGMGLGSLAVAELIKSLNAQNIGEIFINIEDDELLKFYEPLGFYKWGKWQEIYF